MLKRLLYIRDAAASLRLSKKSTALQEMHFCYAKASLWLSALLFCGAENACISCSMGTYVPTNESSEPCLKGINPFRHSHYTLGENAISACGLKSATLVASCVVANFKILIDFRFFDNLRDAEASLFCDGRGFCKTYIILKYAKEQSIPVKFQKSRRRSLPKKFTKGQSMSVNLQNNRAERLAKGNFGVFGLFPSALFFTFYGVIYFLVGIFGLIVVYKFRGIGGEAFSGFCRGGLQLLSGIVLPC